ncbi:glycerophosphodiester phosphodiesterase family protein [Paenisporosarcina sp. TG20]|uniref:glycerophosphodiester phosphodiesterase n=1 Tax=Paenisporosarcina sp. TG20 TaxID=1211706 RepID=UPI0002E53EB1|nr:glycerophosphodiester phosphodiesterase family protein [Paenisporosarcina sp. TG20]
MVYHNNELTLIIILFILLTITLEEGHSSTKNIKTEIIAHRGASLLAPENTNAAFDKAIELNADRLELDVQLSQDGKIVVIHDHTVDRTTNGSGLVKDLSLRNLKQLNAGSWFDLKYSDEKIPTLDEILNKYIKKIDLLIEIKYPQLYPGIEKKIAKAVKSDLNKNNIIIQSFSEASLKLIKKFLPDIPTCLLISGFEFNEINQPKLERISSYADYISLPQMLISSELVKTAQKIGLGVYGWNVNTQGEYLKMQQMRVNGIITNMSNTSSFSKNNIGDSSFIKARESKFKFTDLLNLFNLITKEAKIFLNTFK